MSNDNKSTELNDMKQQLADLTKLVTAFVAGNAEKKETPSKSSDYLGDKINAEIRDNYAKDELAKKAYKAAQFNTDLKPFVEANKEALGSDVVFTFNRINDENIKDPEMKMNYFQKELGEKIIAQKHFADLLADDVEAKRKYDEYQTLSRDEKIRQGQKIWDIAKEMVERNRYVKKQEEINKGYNVLNTSKNHDIRYENKIRKTAHKWLGKDLGEEIVPLMDEF